MSKSHNEFEDLRKLLVCKQYEQPPPGYFVSFSDKVLARIEAEDAVELPSWWSWLLNRFDAKPVLVCAYGLAVSGLLFAGFRLSQFFDAEMASATPGVGGAWLAVAPGSPIFLSDELSNVSTAESVVPSVLTSSRFLREEPSHGLFQGASYRLQAAGLLLRAD